jgi:hypothetical protein
VKVEFTHNVLMRLPRKSWSPLHTVTNMVNWL